MRAPQPVEPNPVIRATALQKRYANGTEALRGVSFDVHAGEIVGLLGSNGAGKTTAVGILTTSVRPTAGHAQIGGFDVVRAPLAARAMTGVVHQDSVLDPEFSGRANLRLHARLWRVPAREIDQRVREMSAAMGCDDYLDRGVQTLSGGQRRRLELARALLARPRALFLDEPTVGLDPAARHRLWELIDRARQDGAVSTVLTTHYLDEAERLCDRVLILERGEVRAEGRPANLIAALGSETLELRVEGDMPAAAAAAQAAVTGHGSPFILGNGLTIPLRNGADGASVMAALEAASVAVVGFAIRRTTLDDVYLRTTGAQINAHAA